MKVNFEQMQETATKMRTSGTEVNQSLKKAYDTMDTSIRASWHGWRIYNKVIEPFNNMVESINEIIRTISDDMPQALERVMQTYRNLGLDEGTTTIGGCIGENVQIIENEAVNDADTKNFEPNEIINQKNSIINLFDSALGAMDNYAAAVNSIEWQGSTGDTFRETYTRVKTQISNSLEIIQEDFDKIIQAATDRLNNGDTDINKYLQM